ncbi:RNA-directed DNA polymerase from mobile element jockey-like [Brachionus plicatilis]|uniref:RNA-directed DNA polymerase from mobile element jockey-like n=1 Tax=Brachionus plicatilis TaxID=10195 RepID=A0A3M7SNC2_BRAPC|nr:RNA-directed DNA polymerase from mobile element jockey-like [Brachionus plicatilis]
MVVEHTYQVSDGCTTNTLDLILTTCEKRVTNIVNKPPLGGLKRVHTVLSWMFKIINNLAKMFDINSNNFFRGDYYLFMNNLKSIDWESSLENKDVDYCHEFFLNAYSNLCSSLIPKRDHSKKKN